MVKVSIIKVNNNSKYNKVNIIWCYKTTVNIVIKRVSMHIIYIYMYKKSILLLNVWVFERQVWFSKSKLGAFGCKQDAFKSNFGLFKS